MDLYFCFPGNLSQSQAVCKIEFDKYLLVFGALLLIMKWLESLFWRRKADSIICYLVTINYSDSKAAMQAFS